MRKLYFLLISICILFSLSACKSSGKLSGEKQSWSEAKKDWRNEDRPVVLEQIGQVSSEKAKSEKVYMAQIKDKKKKKNSNIVIAGVLTEDIWDELFPKRYGVALTGKNSVAEGKSDFYTFEAFVEATRHFPKFLSEGSQQIRRRELAAFLAHLAQETGEFRYLEQITVSRSYSVANRDYPPVSGKDYHGRGPIQLSYNYNYGQFSQAYFGDKNVLLRDPDMLSRDPVVSFASAIWFWMTPQSPKPSCHDVITGQWHPTGVDKEYKRFPGFGLTLNIINAPQCGQPTQGHTQKRFDYYDKYCEYFGTTRGDYCDCEQQVPYGRRTVVKN